MLATDGLDRAPQCVASFSLSGSIKLGKTTVNTGKTNLQIGTIQNADGTSTVVAPPSGAIIADSATVPGGLLGLMCPSDIPFISNICKQLSDGKLNKITATLESVGTPRTSTRSRASSPTSRSSPSGPDPPAEPVPRQQLLHRDQGEADPPAPAQLHRARVRPRPLQRRRHPERGGRHQPHQPPRLHPGRQHLRRPRRQRLRPRAARSDRRRGQPQDGPALPAGKNSLVLNNTQTYLTGLYAPGVVAPTPGRSSPRAGTPRSSNGHPGAITGLVGGARPPGTPTPAQVVCSDEQVS